MTDNTKKKKPHGDDASYATQDVMLSRCESHLVWDHVNPVEVGEIFREIYPPRIRRVVHQKADHKLKRDTAENFSH